MEILLALLPIIVLFVLIVGLQSALRYRKLFILEKKTDIMKKRGVKYVGYYINR